MQQHSIRVDLWPGLVENLSILFATSHDSPRSLPFSYQSLKALDSILSVYQENDILQNNGESDNYFQDVDMRLLVAIGEAKNVLSQIYRTGKLASAHDLSISVTQLLLPR